MVKPPFAYLPLKSAPGKLLSYGLSAFYSLKVAYQLAPKMFRNRVAFAAIKDREGPNRPAVLDQYGVHKFATLPKANIRLHYVSKGNPQKPLMLLVHGFPECWFSWRHQMEEFSRDYHTVAVNMRGYGESDKPVGVANYSADILYSDLVELIQTLTPPGAPKCILVSHDWGGVVAWNIAQRRPDLVDRFIALNAPHPKAWQSRIATSWRQFHSSWYMFFFNAPLLPEVYMRNQDFRFLDLLFGAYHKTAGELDVYKHYFAKPYGVEGPLAYYRAMLRGHKRKNGEVPSADVVTTSTDKRVQPKTLIIWGKDDDALEPELATDSATYCKDARVKYLDRCSHWIQVHRPKEVNELMRQFLMK